jgi:SAM-dependent methyltransferase
MQTKEAMLARAQEIETTQPAEAAELFASILNLDPANLAAHNALERMLATQRYSRWMRVNCVIDPRDDIFRFFANHPLAKNPIREYLSDGWRTLSELMLLLEAVDQPLLKSGSVLEFAAGFGRFTRHLVKVLPGCVTCTDVMPGSIEFLREQFEVQAFESSHEPEKIVTNKRYDLVFVLSMFTHLPPPMWARWLHALKLLVKPGGLLVFSVHNEDIGIEAGVIFNTEGTHFIASSESPSLDSEIYGTTHTTKKFVIDSVRDVFGSEPLLYQEYAFWSGQDAVLIKT